MEHLESKLFQEEKDGRNTDVRLSNLRLKN